MPGRFKVPHRRFNVGLLALIAMELAAILEVADWAITRRQGQRLQGNLQPRSGALCQDNGVTIPFDDAGLVETTDFFRYKDGR